MGVEKRGSRTLVMGVDRSTASSGPAVGKCCPSELDRYSYDVKSIAEELHIKPADVRIFLQGQLDLARSRELSERASRYETGNAPLPTCQPPRSVSPNVSPGPMSASPSQPREPGITEREPDAPDNLTEREPKSPMIASPAADDCRPLHIPGGSGRSVATSRTGGWPDLGRARPRRACVSAGPISR
jgi:hypothetical protein